MPTPVDVYDALKREAKTIAAAIEHFDASEAPDAAETAAELRSRVGQVASEIKRTGPQAVAWLRAEVVRKQSTGDPSARMSQAELDRVQDEVGGGRRVERAASTEGGDAGASRASR